MICQSNVVGDCFHHLCAKITSITAVFCCFRSRIFRMILQQHHEFCSLLIEEHWFLYLKSWMNCGYEDEKLQVRFFHFDLIDCISKLYLQKMDHHLPALLVLKKNNYLNSEVFIWIVLLLALQICLFLTKHFWKQISLNYWLLNCYLLSFLEE